MWQEVLQNHNVLRDDDLPDVCSTAKFLTLHIKEAVGKFPIEL